MICGHNTLPLKCKKDFPSNKHLPKKKNYFVRFLCHIDFIITKMKHLCKLCKKCFSFFIYIFHWWSTFKKYIILPSLQFWPNFNMFLNPKIKTSFREMWVRCKSFMTHCFRKVNNWVTYTVICFKNYNLDTKYYLSLFSKYCGIFLFVLTIFQVIVFIF